MVLPNYEFVSKEVTGDVDRGINLKWRIFIS